MIRTPLGISTWVAYSLLLTGCDTGSTVPSDYDQTKDSWAPSEVDRVVVTKSDDGINVAANNASLRRIITEISSHYDIEVDWRDATDTRVSVNFQSLTVHQALHRLLRNRPYQLHYGGSDSANTLTVFNRVESQAATNSLPADSDLSALEPYSLIETALNHPSDVLRADALAELGTVGDSEALVDTLTLVLAGDSSASVRREAVYALGSLDSEASVAAFEFALTDTHQDVREAAIDGLLEVGDSRALAGLRLAMDDQEPRLRLAAIEALGEIGSDEARIIIHRALSDHDEEIRALAAEYLKTD